MPQKTYNLDNPDEYNKMLDELTPEQIAAYVRMSKGLDKGPTTPGEITLGFKPNGKPITLSKPEGLPDTFGQGLSNRVLWGLGGAALGGATGGGPAGAAIQGASNFLFPPQSEGDVVGQVLNSLPIMRLLDKGGVLTKGAGKLFGRNVGVGAGQYLASEGARQGIDNGSVDMGVPSLVGAATQGAGAGLFGEAARRGMNSTTVREGAQRSATNAELPNLLGRPANIEEFSSKVSDEAQPLRSIFATQNAPRQAELDTLNAQRKLAILKARETQVAKRKIDNMVKTQGEAVDVAEQRIKAAQINTKRDINVAKLNLKAIKEWNIEPLSGKNYNEIVPLKTPSDIDVINRALSEKFSPDQAERMVSFYKGLKEAMGDTFTPKDFTEAIRGMGDPRTAATVEKALSEAPKRAMFEQALEIKKLKDEAAKSYQESITQLQNNILDQDIQKTLGNSKATTGVASDPALRAAQANSKQAQQRAMELGVDLVKEKNDVANIKDAIRDKTKERIFNSPGLNAIMKSNGSGPITDDTLIKNITSASQESLRDAMTELSKHPDAQAALRNTYLTNIFRNSYNHDLDVFDWAAMSKSTDLGKIRELFGGGSAGTAAARNFEDFMSGVKELDMLAQGNAKLRNSSGINKFSKAGIAGVVGLIPTGILFHFPGSHLATGVGLAGLATLPFNQKLIDYIAAQPSFGKEFLKWAASGGSQSALSAYPAVHKYFADNLKSTSSE